MQHLSFRGVVDVGSSWAWFTRSACVLGADPRRGFADSSRCQQWRFAGHRITLISGNLVAGEVPDVSSIRFTRSGVCCCLTRVTPPLWSIMGPGVRPPAGVRGSLFFWGSFVRMVSVKGSGMGKSTMLARLVAVCAVTAVAGGVLASAPVSAQTPDVPSSSVGTPGTSVASPAPVGGDGVTPRAARATGLRIKIAGVTAGGRASVRVTGPKQSTRKKAKKYSKVIHQTAKLRVRPGVYRVTSRDVSATGGTDVLTTVATKKLRVRNNKLTRFTVHYRFVAASCAGGGPCVVGDTGPGGGKVFYVNEANAVGSKYMEAAPSEWSDGVDPILAWGGNVDITDCINLDVTGTSPAIGTGLANTNLIRAACNSPAKAPAAWAVYNYSNGAANSWYLPSRLELNQMCRYARADAFDASATTCAGSGPLVGGFAANWYWSSSQNDPSFAWGQDFLFSDQGGVDKTSLLRVRPVRAF